MTNHFHAFDAQGIAHTRSSKSRAYTHTVVVLRGRAYAARQLALSLKRTEKHARDWFAIEAQRAQGILIGKDATYAPGGYLQHYGAKAIAEAQEFIAANPEVEAYVASERARVTASHERELADGYYDLWFNAGWCGRPDLAHKLAAQQQGFESVVILEAQAGKPAKAAA